MIKLGSLLTTTARYCECPESGAVSDSIESLVRTRTVTNVYQCYKDETRTILAGFDVHPATLLSAGGRNPDGTPANFINWGPGYTYLGADVSEMSPNFSRVSARYSATDPVGGAGTPQSGSGNGCILGRPWEGGLRYVETPSSGKVTESRDYLKDSFGWNICRQVDVNLICEKSDARVVADSLSLAPANLITNPYSGAKIQWRSNYKLVSIYGSSISPTLYAIGAKYRRNQAEAIARPPSGVVLACSGGVCSLAWKTVKFEDLESGDVTNDDGIDVQLLSGGYSVLMTCNSIPFSDFTPSVSSGDKILEWNISGNDANLMFCREIWKSYSV